MAMHKTGTGVFVFCILTSLLVYCLHVNSPRWRNTTVTPSNAAHELPSQKSLTFLKDYKNPCWFEGVNGNSLRCFPFFFLPGFGKCGSSDLIMRIGMHPLILRRQNKSIQRREKVLDPCQGKFQCEVTTYVKTFFGRSSEIISKSNKVESLMNLKDHRKPFWREFPKESKAIWRKGQRRYKYPAIEVDGMAKLARDNAKMRRDVQPQNESRFNFLTALWIKHVRPQTRLIFTLRDPVERTYSNYVYSNQQNSRPSSLKDFHNIVMKSVKALNECLSEFTNPFDCDEIKNLTSIMTGSMYHILIKSWIDTFPLDQIFLSRFEDYTRNPAKTLTKIFRFLGLPHLSKKAMDSIVRKTKKNVTKRKEKMGDMWPETRKILTEFFKPHNEKLAELLGDTRFLWNDAK